MQLHIGSKHLAAGISVQLDVSGREHLVVVAKATWSLPAPGQRPRPLPPQPLAMADQYFGDPGESAMRYGADVLRFKPRCDVIKRQQRQPSLISFTANDPQIPRQPALAHQIKRGRLLARHFFEQFA